MKHGSGTGSESGTSAGNLEDDAKDLTSSSLSSSSCDSVFSTATTGFAFISPSNYQPQAERSIAPDPETDTYRRRLRERDKTRQKNELSLKKKYGLYGTSETLKSEIAPQLGVLVVEGNKNNCSSFNQPGYSDLSLPIFRNPLNSQRQISDTRIISNRQSASTSNFDLIENCSSFRRTVSDYSLKGGTFKRLSHVKGKRKAPPPPVTANSSLSRNSQALSPCSTLGRSTLKKRRAPPPPLQIFRPHDPHSLPLQIFRPPPANTSLDLTPPSPPLNRNRSYELLNDKEIEEIFVRNSFQPDMDRIRYYRAEPKDLTARQKEEIIETVVKNQATERLTTDTLTLEQGLLKPNRNISNLRLDVSKDDVQALPKLSPISPRPWYKRPLSGTRESSAIPFKREVILRTVDKRRNKNRQENENNLPAVNFVRQSKFGLFSRHKEQRRIDSDEVKRRSGIGIPNISELDREAQQILSQKNRDSAKIAQVEDFLRIKDPAPINDESSDDEIDPESGARRRSTKELISKFEATTNSQHVSINTSFIGRSEQFEPKSIAAINGNSTNEEFLSKNSADHQKVADGSGFQKNVTNNNVDKRHPDVNSVDDQNLVGGVWSCPFCTLQNPNWRILCEVCERIKPYENKRLTSVINGNQPSSFAKGKQADPLKVDNENLDRKTDKVIKYFFPKLNGGNNTLSKSASETSVAGNLMGNKMFTKSTYGSPKLGGIRGVFQRFSPDKPSSSSEFLKPGLEIKGSQNLVIARADVRIEEKKNNKSGTPDLEEVRHARLNRFKPQNDKAIVITDKNSLDREKQRLKDMIRAMNAKALAEKYPVMVKTVSLDEHCPETALNSNPEAQVAKFGGAIKKLFRKADPEENDALKLGKVSTSVQTTYARRSEVDSPDFELPGVDLLKFDKRESPIYDNLDGVRLTNNLKLSALDKVKVNELAEQLKSIKGREEFKATLQYSEKTGTLAINKIMRSLEMAIMEGQHELAATLAKDLAKMKVSLSVTRHKVRPLSEVDADINCFM